MAQDFQNGQNIQFEDTQLAHDGMKELYIYTKIISPDLMLVNPIIIIVA